MAPERMLGKLPPVRDPRTLQLSRYYRREEAVPPATRRWDTPVSDWGVMGNNRYGNCVIVTPAHALLSMHANTSGDLARITDAAVIELSRQMRALHGYAILNRLKYWRKTGMWGNKLYAFAAIDTHGPLDFKVAIDEFGWADIGLDMPTAWQDEEVWDTGLSYRYKPGTWGPHSVPLVGYDERLAYCVTWGKLQPITWAAIAKYCDEAYATIDGDWMATTAKTPSGFDWETLEYDLTAFAT